MPRYCRWCTKAVDKWCDADGCSHATLLREGWDDKEVETERYER